MISHSIKLCTIAPILVKIYGNGYLLNYAFFKFLFLQTTLITKDQETLLNYFPL